MKITLTNDFHGTSVTLNADVRSHVHNVSTAYLTENQVRKAKRELCGTAGCSCSGTVHSAPGTRGGGREQRRGFNRRRRVGKRDVRREARQIGSERS